MLRLTEVYQLKSPIQNGLKQIIYCHCFSTSLQNTPLGRSKKFRRKWT